MALYTSKLTKITPDMKMSDVLLSNFSFILMLEHFGISLAVQDKTVKEICAENSINPDIFLTFANLFNGITYEPKAEYSFDDIQTIIGYLKKCHHYYLDDKYPSLKSDITKLAKKNNSAEVKLLEKFFSEYLAELTTHLNYENETVFPYVIKLYRAAIKSKSVSSLGSYSVTEYKEHHDDIEEKLTDIKNLLVKYLPPKNDRKIRRNILLKLFELEHDLHIHSLIEDSILIPLVQKLENHSRQ
jgi:regulator of cell morphogenesis and NO signaling